MPILCEGSMMVHYQQSHPHMWCVPRLQVTLRIQKPREHIPMRHPLRFPLCTLSPWERQQAEDQLSLGSASHPAIIHSCYPSAQSLCLWPECWPMENKLIKGPRSFSPTLMHVGPFWITCGVLRDDPVSESDGMQADMQILWRGLWKLSWRSHSRMPRAPSLWPNVKLLHFSLVSPPFSYLRKAIWCLYPSVCH